MAKATENFCLHQNCLQLHDRHSYSPFSLTQVNLKVFFFTHVDGTRVAIGLSAMFIVFFHTISQKSMQLRS